MCVFRSLSAILLAVFLQACGGGSSGPNPPPPPSPAKTYSVTYDANGGTGGSVPVDSNTYQQGQNAVVLSNSGSLAKSGYSFSGWNTTASGSGTTYSPNQTVSIGTANVTLYAVWTVTATYSVIYTGNGSTSGAVPVDSTQYQTGQAAVVLANSGGLALAGYTFAGWNTQANGGGTTYVPNQMPVIGTSDLTLYAIWTSDPTFSVTYNGNGNTGGSPPVDPNQYYADEAITILGNTGGLVKYGYTFAGWNPLADGAGTTYLPGQVTTNFPSASLLYAVWTLNPPTTLAIDTTSLTAETQLDMNYHDVILSPNVSFQISDDTSTGQDVYTINLANGQLAGTNYFADLVFNTMSASYAPTTRTVAGFSVNEYLASATSLGDYFESIMQTLPASGFQYSGMGNWKYLGPNQAGYYSGHKIATASFIFGTQTPASSVDAIPTSTYLGLAQAAGEASSYYFNYDQLTSNVSVAIDRVAGTVTVNFTNLQYWNDYSWMTLGIGSTEIASFLVTPATAVNPSTLSCAAPIVAATNSFTCTVTGVTGGTVTGRYFGPNGEEVAGTFVFIGAFASQPSGQSVAGSFVAKR